MAFSTVEQRLAQNYLSILPDFIPDEDAPVSPGEQKDFYNIIKTLYTLAAKEPFLFVVKMHEDYALPNYVTKRVRGRARLFQDMKTFTKSVNNLTRSMFLMGQGVEVAPSIRRNRVLSRLGNFSELPPAWKWMSTREGANHTDFLLCHFKRGYPYTSDVFARLLGETAFKRLEGRLLSLGYESFCNNDITARSFKVSLTIANPKWGPEAPKGGFEPGSTHIGISAVFDPYLQNPAVVGLCIPGSVRRFLEPFDSMGEELQRFVTEQTKKCDGCGRCIQNGGIGIGIRKRSCVAASFEDRQYNLCAYFSEDSYRWTSLDDHTADILIKMLSFMEGLLPKGAARHSTSSHTKETATI